MDFKLFIGNEQLINDKLIINVQLSIDREFDTAIA